LSGVRIVSATTSGTILTSSGVCLLRSLKYIQHNYPLMSHLNY
jgi:hypothetical protein